MTCTTTTGRKPIKFGPFQVTDQVFFTTRHSFALVNLKPLIPGHVLVCPHAPHRRLTDMTAEEIADLFTTVQLMQRLLARVYFPSPDPEAGSFSVAVQDGAAAGQTVPHVHVHVIPRQTGDLGTPDAVYVRMAGESGNVGGALWDREMARRPEPGGGLPRVDDEDRRPRTADEMMEEAETYKALLKEMGHM
ncbi:HIT-like domain-containing protein [Mariannaea sp. PMI_226]|nr:HIT-like domain-containing protein [Mariannaea sp. PMI_226]